MPPAAVCAPFARPPLTAPSGSGAWADGRAGGRAGGGAARGVSVLAGAASLPPATSGRSAGRCASGPSAHPPLTSREECRAVQQVPAVVTQVGARGDGDARVLERVEGQGEGRVRGGGSEALPRRRRGPATCSPSAAWARAGCQGWRPLLLPRRQPHALPLPTKGARTPRRCPAAGCPLAARRWRPAPAAAPATARPAAHRGGPWGGRGGGGAGEGWCALGRSPLVAYGAAAHTHAAAASKAPLCTRPTAANPLPAPGPPTCAAQSGSGRPAPP
jgi:hypothetical protein